MAVFKFNDNFEINAPKHIDERYGPHLTVVSALAFIPDFKRFQGLTIGIREFGVNTDPIIEYWFKDGILDNNLIVKGVNVTGSHFMHSQGIPALIWEVVHGLNKRAAVHVESLTGTLIIAQIRYIDDNRVQVIFGRPMAGRAYCN